jgi:hypothetical protein
LCDCTYLEWRIYFRRGIDCFGLNTADLNPVSLVGEYDEQKFATVPSIFAPLKPIHEGVQAEFDE